MSLYLVAGLGKTGQSIAGYLKRRNKPFIVFDTRKEVEGLNEFQQAFPEVKVVLEKFPSRLYPKLAGIITSPGIPLETPFLQEALRLKIPVYGDIECLAKEVTSPVIAITGTNGKSTVTSLVGEMARASGLSVAVAGNIGLPVLDLLDDKKHYDLWVLELSSFQLDLTHSLTPLAATILNISADHLDRHHNLTAYIKSKQRIYNQSQWLVYNREDKHTLPAPLQAKQVSFGLGEGSRGHWGIIEQANQHYLAYGNECLLAADNLRIKGKHNWQNALAACALATAAGIELKYQLRVLENFAGLPHRCQWVRILDGVTWINDSKGTNVGAAISALSGIGGSIPGRIVLIAGGLGKGADFTELSPVVAEYARSVILIGEDANKIQKALNGIVGLHQAASLEKAIHLAKAEAKPGDVVLLSPACASFDMFRDFNHRGETFANLVRQL